MTQTELFESVKEVEPVQKFDVNTGLYYLLKSKDVQNEAKYHYRRGGPAESRESGEKLIRSGELTGQKNTVLNALKRWNERTSKELAELAELPHPMIHKRLPDLLRLGLVSKGGTRDGQAVWKTEGDW